MSRELNAAPLRVLIVEDEGLQAEELACLMQEWGHQVVAKAASVGAALDVIDAEEVDVAIVDLDLDENGFGGDLIEYLDRQQGVPSIVVSGRLTRLNRAAVGSLGSHVTAILPKPYDYDELSGALGRIAEAQNRSAA